MIFYDVYPDSDIVLTTFVMNLHENFDIGPRAETRLIPLTLFSHASAGAKQPSPAMSHFLWRGRSPVVKASHIKFVIMLFQVDSPRGTGVTPSGNFQRLNATTRRRTAWVLRKLL